MVVYRYKREKNNNVKNIYNIIKNNSFKSQEIQCYNIIHHTNDTPWKHCIATIFTINQ